MSDIAILLVTLLVAAVDTFVGEVGVIVNLISIMLLSRNALMERDSFLEKVSTILKECSELHPRGRHRRQSNQTIVEINSTHCNKVCNAPNCRERIGPYL